MSDNVTEFLILGVSVLFLALFIITATALVRTGSKIPNSVANNITEAAEDMDEAEFIKFDGVVVSGSDVLSAVRKYKDSGILVTVKTVNNGVNRTLTTNGVLSGSIQNLPSNSDTYINPGANFMGNIGRNKNEVINALTFVQTESMQIPTAYSGSSPVVVTGNLEASTDSTPTAESIDTSTIDLVFSDEQNQQQKQENEVSTESSSYVGTIQKSIEVYSSKINDCLQAIKDFDCDTDTQSDLVTIKGQLVGLMGDLSNLAKQVTTSTAIDSETKAEINKTLTDLTTKINVAINSIDSLCETLKETEDSANLWYCGYPVEQSVQAVLNKGTLTIKGSGRVKDFVGLPKWSTKSKEIKKVVFENGVKPEKIDDWFSGCSNLESVNFIPDSVVSMNNTFEGCTRLTGTLQIKSKSVISASGFRSCIKEPASLVVKAIKNSETWKAISLYIDSVDKSKHALTLGVI